MQSDLHFSPSLLILAVVHIPRYLIVDDESGRCQRRNLLIYIRFQRHNLLIYAIRSNSFLKGEMFKTFCWVVALCLLRPILLRFQVVCNITPLRNRGRISLSFLNDMLWSWHPVTDIVDTLFLDWFILLLRGGDQSCVLFKLLPLIKLLLLLHFHY